ncbi:MAG: DUF4445 domain-containing protein [Actinobacteria bacterium]|nr:DUF4445 domain-containing protein [Actinomycetota bacterium]MCG2819601.1 ASKHA domain-containing protein [Actinomycetes bacterium]MBU4218094.1 DUF4445 domain-containing protein [Actinomycetota bacterium]MBU4357954.1 DUF4445 domain-containing protein [Actinomycetota bacterium]MBU4391474.1 DUF4445 domain-containing protein [Actinomycetota bacterium]
MKHGGGSFEVRFDPPGRSAVVHAGATVMDAAVLCGVRIDAPCGSGGNCGKCRVHAEGLLAPPTGAELDAISAGDLEEGFRLACQAVVLGPVEVEPPSTPAGTDVKSGLGGEGAVTVDLPGVPGSSPSGKPLGAAVDVGTTTLCVSVLDLTDGSRVGIASSENPQARFGADVMSRIERYSRDPGARELMHLDVTSSINGLLRGLTDSVGRLPGDLVRLVMVGNTTMVHIALGEDPSPLGTSPFEPPVWGPVDVGPSDVGLEAAPTSRLLVPRVLSGFLGADIVACILALGVGDSPETLMVVDMGTNGEIALGNRDRVVACSTAAGPAFEGAMISSGMRAAPGAIEAYSRDGELIPIVLGGGEPSGICGSGLLDSVAALLDAGLLLPSGRLLPPEEAQEIAPGRITGNARQREFHLAPGTGLTLNQDDIRQVQLAKGAMRAGVDILCSSMGTNYERIDRVYLAGVFGSFLKPSSAIAVGLLPHFLESHVEYAGNAALSGAEMMLASERHWSHALEISERVEVANLSGDPLFEKAFIESLSFPDNP